MKEQGLEFRVRANAADKKYNLRQFKNDTHHKVCKILVQLSDEWKDEKGKPFPICYIVYFAIGKNAHRTEVFNEGYKAIDEMKARKIMSWASMYANHMGNAKLARNTDLLHALTRFYEKVSTSSADFADKLNALSPQKKIENFKAVMALLS